MEQKKDQYSQNSQLDYFYTPCSDTIIPKHTPRHIFILGHHNKSLIRSVDYYKMKFISNIALFMISLLVNYSFIQKII